MLWDTGESRRSDPIRQAFYVILDIPFRVRFRPGWDCHGLPIELKISKSVQVCGFVLLTIVMLWIDIFSRVSHLLKSDRLLGRLQTKPLESR